MGKDISFVDHTYPEKSLSSAPGPEGKKVHSDNTKRKSPAVSAMERVGAAEVLLVCESVKAISTIGATLTGRLTGKLVSVEKDARKTLNVD
jgi:hypothetical protein